MNKALFSRKAAALDDIKRRSGEERDKAYYAIEKIVELSAPDFSVFAGNLLDDFDFIEDNIGLMYVDAEGVKHCILVKEEGESYGVLVESEGYSYARYAAYYEE